MYNVQKYRSCTVLTAEYFNSYVTKNDRLASSYLNALMEMQMFPYGCCIHVYAVGDVKQTLALMMGQFALIQIF
jgi:hypothetical protein